MRILRFIISGQSIKKDPSCDFTGLVPGTKGYLTALFIFDRDWDGCKKAAVFKCLGKDYPAPIINGQCEIPAQALTWNSFKVSVVGRRDGYQITTGRTEVRQDG